MGVSMNMPTAPVQMDANMGVINAVQEMLLQASPGVLKLLPALPDRWRRGRLADWRFHTGRVTLEWDLDTGSFHAEVTADRDTELTVLLPDWAVFAGIELDGPEGAAVANGLGAKGHEGSGQGTGGQEKPDQGAKEQGAKEHGVKEHGAKEHRVKEHEVKEHGAKEQGATAQGLSGYKLRLAQGSPPVVFRIVSCSC
jgi:hypothetical protein